MKRDKIESVPTPRIVTKELVTLSTKEIEVFLHNAQLALCDAVEDCNHNLFVHKQALVHLFQSSQLSAGEIALVLVSAAWDIYTGKKEK